MKKEMWIFIIVLFMCIGAVLGIFCYNKSNEYEYSFQLPLNVETITIEQNKIEATIEDSNEINDIINILSGTGRKPIAESIQDFPTNVENVISVHFNGGEIFTFYVYEKNNEYFIERAYNGIYRISPDEYNLIEKYVRNERNTSDVITGGTSVNEIFDIAVSYANWSDFNKIYTIPLNISKMAISSEIHFPIYKFDTLSELEQFKTVVDGILSIDQKYGEIPSFNDVTIKYDEDFFDKNTLMLVYVDASSGSCRYGVDSISHTDGNFCIHIKQTNNPEIHTDDMAGWFITVAVSDSMVADCTSFDADFNNGFN